MKEKSLKKLYKELKKKYGKPCGQWILWCKRPKTEKEREEVVIGAILTQRTNWKNVEIAINNLKRAKINSLKDICQADKRSLAPLIRPSGFYRVKARYLFSLAKFMVENYGSLDKMRKEKLSYLREELLKLKGIGPETADSILLYGLNKSIFVIDEYTRRLVKERKMSQNLSYEFLQELFEKNLPKNFRLYQDFHALVVIKGKDR
jgi:endonuclease-3 related protein